MNPLLAIGTRRHIAAKLALSLFLAVPLAHAQVLTIDTSGKNPPKSNGPVNREYAQIEPTHVDLPKAPLDEKTRLALIRALQSEQGFAMRPLPRGHKGLTLEANGKLTPAGEPYLNEIIANGVSVKPGERVVISDIKIEKEKLVFELNGGPDAAHRFLSHVEVGVGMGGTQPVVDDGSKATGSRLTLAFEKHIPALSPAQVKDLIAPLISFDVKSPVQAYTDTLPKTLKEAILDHQVLVGMSLDMVVFAKGQPITKSREMDGQMPFEEWIYGKPPETVYFVRINGNRVIRVEVARNGEKPVIYSDDVVSPMLLAEGKAPVNAARDNTRTIREGDVDNDPNKQAGRPLPTLGKPNPDDKPAATTTDVYGRPQTMGPVHPPKPHTDDSTTLGANPDDQQPAATPSDATQPTATPPDATQPIVTPPDAK
jgi:hypothetical protein